MVANEHFNAVLKLQQIQRLHMLMKVSPLLTHGDRSELSRRYPSVSYCFDIDLEGDLEDDLDERDFDPRADGIDSLVNRTFDDALQHALELAKCRNPPRFAELALKTFGKPHTLCSPIDIFAEGFLCEFFSWKPDSWCLPSDEGLATVEALLTQLAMNHNIYMAAYNTRWYFSAAAELIEYCEYLLGDVTRYQPPLADLVNPTTLVPSKTW